MTRLLLLKNICQIVQIVDDREQECLAGNNMKNIKILNCPKASLAILCRDGRIEAISTLEEIVSDRLKDEKSDGYETVDCSGGSVIPGLVDGHTHPVFAGDRVHEFAMKLAGATYMDIQAMGGGIHFTAAETKRASSDQLLTDFLAIAQEMLASGTTLIEAKSGYGLERDTELKMLEVLERAQAETPIEISATFCGAHAVPKGSTEFEQAEAIVDEWLPAIAQLRTKAVGFWNAVSEWGCGQIFMPTNFTRSVVRNSPQRSEIVHTPGHTADHMALFFVEEGAIFSGDCILGESTAIFEDLQTYMGSLQKLLELKPLKIYPGHGPVIEKAEEKILEYISHRQKRESEILEVLRRAGKNGMTPMMIVREVYPEIPIAKKVAAMGNVKHHLEKLVKDGKVAVLRGVYTIAVNETNEDQQSNDEQLKARSSSLSNSNSKI